MRIAVEPQLSWQQRMSDWEMPLCRLCHERSSLSVRRLFGVVSRLGDGHYGYLVLSLLFVLLGPAALSVATQAAAVALIGHVLYKSLKRKTARPRPLHAAAGSGYVFDFTVPPLDRYSFPSGHTLHAVAFAFVVSAHVPILALLLVPFAVLVALSRVVLGLHYPTDVLAGAVLGLGLAWGSFAV